MLRSLCRSARVAQLSSLCTRHQAIIPSSSSTSTSSNAAKALRHSTTAHTRRCPGTASSYTLCTSTRHLSYVTNASNFETEVIQSQQAICLVYYISNSNCSAYLKSAEKLVDAINAETAGLDVPAAAAPASSADGLTVEVEGTAAGQPNNDNANLSSTANAPQQQQQQQQRQQVQWLKLCTINADENRNLASAFSVERAKLPITYFVMQGTIVDKVVGHVAEGRLQSILIKFLEHYQQEMHVDLLARHGKAGADGKGDSASSPLPSAATADLLSGTSTTFLQDKMMNALVGADMIQLPEEAEQLDGVRRTLQDAKKKAHAELQELHKQLGMDIRRLTDAEMHAHYFNSPQFRALGVLSALEALFLARCYATLGDVPRANVDWARRAVQADFEAIHGDPALRRVMALVDVNIVRGELRMAATLAAQDANRLRGTLASMDAGDLQSAAHRTALLEMERVIAEQSQYCLEMLQMMDAHVDSRTLDSSTFPSAVVDRLFEMLKANQKVGRTRLPAASSAAASASAAAAAAAAPEQRQAGEETAMVEVLEGKVLDTTAKKVLTAQARVPQIRTMVTSLVQLYASDPKAQAARSRLSSLMY